MNICSKRSIFGIFFIACMTTSLIGTISLSAATHPDDQAYLTRAMEAPLTFTVPKAQSDEVWSRIRSFMLRYLNGGTRGTITDSVAATAPLHAGIIREGKIQASEYLASRIVSVDVVKFSIQSDLFNTNKKNVEQGSYIWTNADLKIVERNLHLWALYARTGEIQPELVDKTH